MRPILLSATSFAFFTLFAYLGFRFAPSPVHNHNPLPSSQADAAENVIVLIHDEPVLPPGPGREEFATSCVVCHSPRYITMQPRFSRSVWKAEVRKMVSSYGAPIGEPTQTQIVDYLVANFSSESTAR